MGESSAQSLKDEVIACIESCRQELALGRADMSPLEHSVKAYCAAVSLLPPEEASVHARILEKLMVEVTELGEALTTAHEAIRLELSALGRLKQASVAYHKSDGIGLVRRPKEEP